MSVIIISFIISVPILVLSCIKNWKEENKKQKTIWSYIIPILEEMIIVFLGAILAMQLDSLSENIKKTESVKAFSDNMAYIIVEDIDRLVPVSNRIYNPNNPEMIDDGMSMAVNDFINGEEIIIGDLNMILNDKELIEIVSPDMYMLLRNRINSFLWNYNEVKTQYQREDNKLALDTMIGTIGIGLEIAKVCEIISEYPRLEFIPTARNPIGYNDNPKIDSLSYSIDYDLLYEQFVDDINLKYNSDFKTHGRIDPITSFNIVNVDYR